MAEPEKQATRNGNSVTMSDKLTFFSEHVRGVMTLASAAVPAIVGVFGLLFRKDQAGNTVLPDFAKAWLILAALAILSFLISILAGVAYSFFLCRKTNDIQVRIPELDWASLGLHLFFALGVALFSVWAFLMVFHLT